MDIHLARADARRAKALANTESPYTIEVRFMGGLSETQKAAFAAAADRWARVIVGDLPDVRIPELEGLPAGIAAGERIDDLVILAEGAKIDGPGTEQGNILGQAGPLLLRSGSALPAVGVMRFDTFDLDRMEQTGLLHDVIVHEMGHALGFGTIWETLGLSTGLGGPDPTFVGPAASREFGVLLGAAGPHAVPVENVGGPGSVGGHWRESVFGVELMTSRVSQLGNPISRTSIAALEDMGYQVDLAAAEPYVLPSPLFMAEVRGMRPEVAPTCTVAAPEPIATI
ncbi:leishmanolysin-related zinc metalloendopeptidase [Nonomuraea sp. NPDC004354]